NGTAGGNDPADGAEEGHVRDAEAVGPAGKDCGLVDQRLTDVEHHGTNVHGLGVYTPPQGMFGGRRTANSSVICRLRSRNRKSAAGRPPERPEGTARPVSSICPLRRRTRRRLVAATSWPRAER